MIVAIHRRRGRGGIGKRRGEETGKEYEKEGKGGEEQKGDEGTGGNILKGKGVNGCFKILRLKFSCQPFIKRRKATA